MGWVRLMGTLFHFPRLRKQPPPPEHEDGDDDRPMSVAVEWSGIDGQDIGFALALFTLFCLLVGGMIIVHHISEREQRECMLQCMRTIPGITATGCEKVCGSELR